MSPTRALKVVLALAFGASLPTIVALIHYAITGDPTLRPLGLTQKKLWAFAFGRQSGVEVTVLWGENAPSNTSRDQFVDTLERAMRARDIAANVELVEIAGRTVSVYFQVGELHYGPYSANNAAAGVSAATAAWRYVR